MKTMKIISSHIIRVMPQITSWILAGIFQLSIHRIECHSSPVSSESRKGVEKRDLWRRGVSGCKRLVLKHLPRPWFTSSCLKATGHRDQPYSRHQHRSPSASQFLSLGFPATSLNLFSLGNFKMASRQGAHFYSQEQQRYLFCQDEQVCDISQSFGLVARSLPSALFPSCALQVLRRCSHFPGPFSLFLPPHFLSLPPPSLSSLAVHSMS